VKGFRGFFLGIPKGLLEKAHGPYRKGNWRNMAKRNQNTFQKRKKEIERKRKAQEKMERRQGKKNKSEESNETLISDQI
jgi:hypothetical protein